MSKIKKIIGMVIFLFIMGHTCFADVIMPGENPRNHGGGYYNVNQNYSTNNSVANRASNNVSNSSVVEESADGMQIVTYVVIGILIIVIVFCTIMVIREIVKKKEE